MVFFRRPWYAIVPFLFVAFHATGQDLNGLSSQQPVQLSGNLSLTNSFYGVTNIPNRRSPYAYIMNGNATLQLYGISIPFSFIYSDEQSSFSQPFNQFGLSPHYKWATLHLGYRNVTFSPFTLAGHTFLGGGLELNPGILRFGVVYGRFKEAIPEDTTAVPRSRLYQMALPSYKRSGYAVKLGLGGEKNYFDLIMMKAEDDSSSIPYSPTRYDVAPGENTVFGISNKFTLFKKITWQNELAASIYTLDTRADAIDISDFPMQNFAETVFDPKTSTQLLSAVESRLSYRHKLFSMQLKYRRVDPDYKSMGAYYFLTDIEQYTFIPSFSLFQQKVFINASLGLQRDNLNDKKLATTHRQIGSFNLSYNPSAIFGINIKYSNYGISQNSGLKRLTDTIRLQQVTKNIGLAPHLNFINERVSHNISMYVGYQELDDDNRFTSAYTEMNSFNGQLNYNLRFIKNQFTLNPSLSYINSAFQSGETKSIGIAMGANKPLWDNALTMNLRMGYNKNYFQSLSNGFTFTTNTSFVVRPFGGTNHSLNLSLRWIRNQAEDNTLVDSFSEFTGNLGYHYTF